MQEYVCGAAVPLMINPIRSQAAHTFLGEPPHMTFHRVTIACLTLTLVVTLTGCAATTASLDSALSLGAAKTTTTATPTPKPVAGDTEAGGRRHRR
jgi:hypothetical protein